ncbi:MAG: type I methionyl aminopeptidase [Tissierellales bacterium]|jgi:methionyl aminopeptidase|nr:type I methionyl aminopeptidase [Tissierellales bacterium]MBN2827128.1 type I methionyl aminopeptidase [Tissierellales bacterium]
MIIIKTDREIQLMREAGRINAQAHDLVKQLITPGITTMELDQAVEEFIRSKNAIPAFKGYQGFPATICASVNEEVVHGIPGGRVLKDGDIISIDIGNLFEGYAGDSADTYPVGTISQEAKKLIEVTRKSFYEGIKFAKEGYRLSDISHAVQKCVEKEGFSVVRDFVGHGIGKELHEDPQIPNFGKPGRGPRLQKGMVLAIEPMVNQGVYNVWLLENDWTVITRDGKLSAHYEHTIAITDGEPAILTSL